MDNDSEYLVMSFSALIIGILGLLKGKGVISQNDVRTVFETATYRLEEIGLPEGGTPWKAHNFLTSLQAMVDENAPKPLSNT